MYIQEITPLIYSVCNKYDYKEKEDLFQQGVIGVIKAYNNYIPNLETKFSSYAYPYIIGEISTYVRENKSIKVTKDMARLGNKINEYKEKHLEVRGYEPSVDDIANMLGISKDKVILAMESVRNIKSLDEKINLDGKEITLLDITPQKERINKEQMLDLKEAFKYLDNEEKELLMNRYFNDLTQNEIAELLGVNQVYVSRLEKKALNKMKSKMVA